MKIGMVGLGRMGGNMALRLKASGHEVVGYVRNPSVSDVASLKDLVSALAPRRVVWIMIPAGPPTEDTIRELSGRLSEGDLIIDGGNSNYADSIRRGEQLQEKGIGFIDAGVSGGIWGREAGYCLMVGGAADDVSYMSEVFHALAPTDGFVHAGPAGAGHFTKMVHNGVEYAMMQAFGEGYELLKASELGIDVDSTLGAWRHGSVVRSWLLELLVDALRDDPGLEGISGWAEDSGEGRWTVQESVRLGVPAPAISAALFARFSSRQDESPAMKVVAALRQQFGGHAIKP